MRAPSLSVVAPPSEPKSSSYISSISSMQQDQACAFSLINVSCLLDQVIDWSLLEMSDVRSAYLISFHITLQNSTAEHSIPEQKTEQSGPMFKWPVCRYAVNRWSTTSSSETPHTHTHGLNQIEGWVVLFCFLFNDDLGRLTATCVEECSRVVMLASFCVTAGFLDVACASKRLW